MFEQIYREIVENDTIIIHRHSNPDGDALGSQIGLKHLIRDNFPDKRVYAVGDPAGRYAFMEDSQMDVVEDELYDDALAIVLDVSAKALISDGRYANARRIARIDHHIFCEKIAEAEETDSSFESCSGMIACFAEEYGLKVSPLAAKSLYTGMVTDSGRFRYDSTSSRTFRTAAFLMQTPFDLNDIYRDLYAGDLEQLRLRAQFVLKIQTTERGVAYIYTPLEEFKACGIDAFTISRGMVGVMADIRGVDIWVNFTETERGVLCELRSSRYNINPIAVRYGGGGHAKASGATLTDRAQAMAMLEDLNKLTMGAEQ